MVNFRIISKIIGSLLFIEAFFMAQCALISFLYHEDDLIAFLISLLITFASGFVFLYFGRDSDNSLSRRDAYVVVTAAWVVFSFFGMFPFLIHGCIPNITDAFFESTSGFTTTGASIIDDVEILPHAILFWRSLTQWIGGLGIVFFTIAILPSLVGDRQNNMPCGSISTSSIIEAPVVVKPDVDSKKASVMLVIQPWVRNGNIPNTENTSQAAVTSR